MKKALITGITGQDGSYLAEFLLSKGYEVHGIVRNNAIENPEHRFYRINHILEKLTLHSASLENYGSIYNVLEKVQPDECYHLAAISFVSYSFEDPFSTINTNVNGTLSVLSAIKERVPRCRFYFAGTSEMFGNVNESPQNENTPFNPRSPYGISKVTGYHLTKNFRESYNMFALSGILFNHESPRRGYEFVSRKITTTVAKIKLGLVKELKLGSLEPKRDWGFAGDYVKAMWLMLQQDSSEDYVIASGECHSVKEFAETAFASVDLDWKEYTKIDEKFYRPAEVFELKGDYSKAKKKLNWEPEVSFCDLVKDMVNHDLALLKKQISNVSVVR
ncbi:MAG: GDP-mannose 4,6-dehydratase [Candidatus Melainabacteria bacterium RIFCSPLOWO2_02_FULL_35_15]|nr:MAG: GDP-mannose 4,6-dehydratase [Candidatus Melainabacteria bacterium RIFCSPLOWO2_12_FULL_35_11]OGI14582.1 MAG: GDP-mannose 4,6-dehydratase [Candidatus Melainabacteria bacterium RIFCSPLOWO2_02_FULL_35_15]